jgi:putative endonuclease
MSRARVSLGIAGENLACEELQRRGYAILARRYRRPSGEIDIIALEADTVVFIEVKTRTGVEYGSGAEAVTAAKQRRLARLASEFMVRSGFTNRSCRFDVVAIVLDGERTAVEVYTNAFHAGR